MAMYSTFAKFRTTNYTLTDELLERTIGCIRHGLPALELKIKKKKRLDKIKKSC